MKHVWIACVCLLACSGGHAGAALFSEAPDGGVSVTGEDAEALPDAMPPREHPDAPAVQQTDGGGTDGDAVGSGGAPARACQTGDTRTCLGPGACVGAQECLPDGSGYGGCDCGPIGTGGTGGSVGGSGGAAPVCLPGTEVTSTIQCPSGAVTCTRVCLPDGSGYSSCC